MTNTQTIHIELTIRIDHGAKDDVHQAKKGRTIEDIHDQCFDELKEELKQIFSSPHDFTQFFSEQTLKNLVQSMPYVVPLPWKSRFHSVFRRSKEKFLKNVHEISEEMFNEFGLHRLIRLFQRFGSQRDELKRQQNGSDSEEDLDFSIDLTERSTRSGSSKRPSNSIITISSKRKRASGISI